MGQTEGLLRLKIREISLTNTEFITETRFYHYSVHPDRRPFIRVFDAAEGDYERIQGIFPYR